MSNILRIPMPDSIYDELDDAFVGEKETPQLFIWEQIRALCRDAKIGRLNKNCTVNVIKDGVPATDNVKLRGFELPEASHDPTWLPPNMEQEDVKYYEHKVTDKTIEYLRLFCSFALLRHNKYADSIEEDNKKKLQKMIDGKAKQEQIDDAKENFVKGVQKFRDATPKCVEEIIKQHHKKKLFGRFFFRWICFFVFFVKFLVYILDNFCMDLLIDVVEDDLFYTFWCSISEFIDCFSKIFFCIID